MKFKDFMEGLARSKGKPMTENEVLLFAKLWNAVVECVADEWPVLGEQILKLKVSAKEKHAGH